MVITSPSTSAGGPACVLSLVLYLLILLTIPSNVRGDHTPAHSIELSEITVDDNDKNIHLYTNDWKTSYLTSFIAHQIINENILHDDERSAILHHEISADRDAVLAFIGGKVPPASAALEIWQGAFQKETSDEKFLRLGLVGLVTSVGWYVPGYFLDEYPEAAFWDFYTNDLAAELLATEETAPLGRFLGMDVGYGDNIITDQVIKNYEMPLKHIYAGGDSQTIDILVNVTAAKEPILLYWWSPRDNTARFDLKRVALPPITTKCVETYSSNDGTYDCDFIPEHPVKIATFGLRETAPEVFSFLKKYELTNLDYETMLAQLDEGDDVATVAARWVAENEDVWMPMLVYDSSDEGNVIEPCYFYDTTTSSCNNSTNTPGEGSPNNATSSPEGSPAVDIGDKSSSDNTTSTPGKISTTNGSEKSSSGANILPLGTTLVTLATIFVIIFT